MSKANKLLFDRTPVDRAVAKVAKHAVIDVRALVATSLLAFRRQGPASRNMAQHNPVALTELPKPLDNPQYDTENGVPIG